MGKQLIQPTRELAQRRMWDCLYSEQKQKGPQTSLLFLPILFFCTVLEHAVLLAYNEISSQVKQFSPWWCQGTECLVEVKCHPKWKKYWVWGQVLLLLLMCHGDWNFQGMEQISLLGEHVLYCAVLRAERLGELPYSNTQWPALFLERTPPHQGRNL